MPNATRDEAMPDATRMYLCLMQIWTGLFKAFLIHSQGAELNARSSAKCQGKRCNCAHGIGATAKSNICMHVCFLSLVCALAFF